MNINADPNYPIIDGFVLNTSLKRNLRFRSLAMEKYEAIRRSGAFRTKYWVVAPPLIIQNGAFIQIGAFDSLEYGLPVVPGSAIWGFIWVNAFPDTNPGPFSFQVTESCTDVPLFSEVIRADQFASSDGIQPPPEQQLLPSPIIIPEPGLLNVQICSQQTTPVGGIGVGGGFPNIQLILCGGEPARFA